LSFLRVHMHSDVENPTSAERESQMRFGPEVALAVDCRHFSGEQVDGERLTSEEYQARIAE